jgi:hypothetical protein
MNLNPLEKRAFCQMVNKFPAFYGTRICTVVITRTGRCKQANRKEFSLQQSASNVRSIKTVPVSTMYLIAPYSTNIYCLLQLSTDCTALNRTKRFCV